MVGPTTFQSGGDRPHHFLVVFLLFKLEKHSLLTKTSQLLKYVLIHLILMSYRKVCNGRLIRSYACIHYPLYFHLGRLRSSEGTDYSQS